MTSVQHPRCANSRCEVPATNFCKQDHDDFRACPSYQDGLRTNGQEAHADEVKAVANDELRPAWSGNAFTPSTSTIVWAASRPPIIALVGLPESGKTSFLATLYLRVKRELIAERQFNGSLTLRAWSKLASRMEWRDGHSPKYPPRTSGDVREPGFLHISLRGSNDAVTDVLIADTPGEWYMHWISRADHPQAEAARWTVDHADEILVFVDVAALINPGLQYNTRSQTERLIDRVCDRQPQGRVSVVYAKHDAATDGLMPALARVRDRLEQRFPGHKAFETIAAPESQSEPGKGVAETIGALLTQSTSSSPQRQELSDPAPLLARFLAS